MTSYSKISFCCDIKDPLNPYDSLAIRRDFSTPGYDIIRDGDTVTVSCAIGSFETPWTNVVYAVRRAETAITHNDESPTDSGIKKKTVKK